MSVDCLWQSLLLAAEKDQVDVVDDLLAESKLLPCPLSILATATPNALFLLALRASALGCCQVLDCLLKEPRIDLAPEGREALIFHVAVANQTEKSATVVRQLLAHPTASPHCGKLAGMSVLELAAANGDLANVEALLGDSRIREDLTEQPGYHVPAAHAARHGHVAVLELLLADPLIDGTMAGSDYWDDSPPESLEDALPVPDAPFLGAAEAGRVAVIECLLRHQDIHPNLMGDVAGATPLHFAAAAGQTGVVDCLLADPRVHPALGDFYGVSAFGAGLGRGQYKRMAAECDASRRMSACRRLLLELRLLRVLLRSGGERGAADMRTVGIDVAAMADRAWSRRRAAVAARSAALQPEAADL